MSIFETLKFTDLSLGRMQVVDDMAVVPLIGKDRGEVADAKNLSFKSTVEYGSMVFKNDDSRPAIVPSNYMVRGRGGQDHATSSVAIIGANKSETLTNACCIESSQGGMLGSNSNQEDILPVSLRKVLLNKSLRSKRSFQKLWDHISKWLGGMRLGSSAHLRFFYDNKEIQKELERFAAEFEPVTNQIGAVVLFSDIPVGLEIMPTADHWRTYWKQLIRGSYGAELIRLKRLGKMKPSTLILPKFPDKATPEEVGQLIFDFNQHLSEEVLPILENIKVKKLDSIQSKDSLKSNLVVLESGGGGDIVQQGDEPVYLSLVL
ncbi:MAG: ARPP-1 family domain-containing protein [Candidatus Heimdallarchaeaceae archaeon]